MYLHVLAHVCVHAHSHSHSHSHVHLHAHAHVVLRTGHGIGPRVRFLSGFGEWIWIQAELHLRHKSETAAPQYWEIKIRALRCVCSVYMYCEITMHIDCENTRSVQALTNSVERINSRLCIVCA